LATILLIAALVIRVEYVQRTSYKTINDAGSYMSLGSQVANSGDYTSTHGAGGTRGGTAYFAPGYPYLIAGLDIVDGHRAGGPSSVHSTRVGQALLGTAAVGLIGLVGLEAFGPLVGLVALALAAVYPVFVELDGTIVAENLLVVFELAAVWAALRARRSGRPLRWVAATGVLTGLATLTHENAALLLVALLAAVWTRAPRLSRRSLAAPALLLATTALTIVPWTIRNAVELHAFIPVSDETGITLVGTYNPASAAFEPVPYKWRLYYGIPGEHALIREARRLTEPQLGARLQSQALHYIAAHPLSPLEVAFHNTLRLFELEGTFAWKASAAAIGLHADVAGVGVVSFWVLCVLALLGLATTAVRRGPKWIWGVPLLLGLSVVLVNVETPRFREPVDPFLVLLAASAIVAVIGRLRGRAPVGRVREPAAPAGDLELVEVVKRLT
jgi:4-amino-4-deoxy-L-arabinose transferase-like glycosyltransferase